MHEQLTRYLTDVYRRDILGESVGVEMPAADPELIASAQAEIARIDALRLGPHLANRAWVDYQNRRALVQLLAQLKAQEAGGDASDGEGQ